MSEPKHAGQRRRRGRGERTYGAHRVAGSGKLLAIWGEAQVIEKARANPEPPPLPANVEPVTGEPPAQA
jgi:hypothetical protein